ncbi:Oidioi.mRNA.OKI2018_I69.chr2.g5012.t1.cds [Oikopleura dioica]|uniref:Oidioi.mRNA.OKI2018_I69.chr2.g5012.t1.cds n=1 Tax=Oikopleura dioica TaxID=34765 RepID=A0ABN7T8A8_OIKDI|nr:Oidioi.mRNA.OKI2018_I69.chr2.g5012.t1.cds [Oikopleura dioica]
MPRKNDNSSMAAYLSGNAPPAHPAQQKIIFTPGHHRGRNGAPRAPKMPEKPVAPFVRYSQKHWDTVKTNNPDMKMWEISKFIAKMWRDAAEEERETFIQGYDAEKKQYHELVKRYYSSPQYQNYLQQKQRWDSAEVRDDDEMTFSMEPIDDVATDDNSCSNRAVHAMRYHRNTYHMLEILSDNNVNNHMKIMRADQIQALDYHRNSLTNSIAQKKDDIDSAKQEHEAKKRRWEQNSEDLENEWKRLAEMTPQEYFKEYTKKQEDLKKQREKEEEKRRQEEEEKARLKKLEAERQAKLAAEEAAKNPPQQQAAAEEKEIKTENNGVSESNEAELEQMETNIPAPTKRQALDVPKTEPVSTEDASAPVAPVSAAPVAQNPLAAMNQLVGNVDKPVAAEVPTLASEPAKMEAQSQAVKAEPVSQEEATPTPKAPEETAAPAAASSDAVKTEEASSSEAMETDQPPVETNEKPSES